MKLQITALESQLDDLNKKGQSSSATRTRSSKEAEHKNEIKVPEQVVIEMKSQMGTGAGAASGEKPRACLKIPRSLLSRYGEMMWS